MPTLGHLIFDDNGVPCSSGVEWESMTLAPSDDSLGVPHFRSTDFNTLQEGMGFVSGIALSRESLPTTTTGVFALLDSWLYPELMPRP